MQQMVSTLFLANCQLHNGIYYRNKYLYIIQALYIVDYNSLWKC